jgi:hypothetical protein
MANPFSKFVGPIPVGFKEPGCARFTIGAGLTRKQTDSVLAAMERAGIEVADAAWTSDDFVFSSTAFVGMLRAPSTPAPSPPKELGNVEFTISGSNPEAVDEAVRLIGGKASIASGVIERSVGPIKKTLSGVATICEPAAPSPPAAKETAPKESGSGQRIEMAISSDAGNVSVGTHEKIVAAFCGEGFCAVHTILRKGTLVISATLPDPPVAPQIKTKKLGRVDFQIEGTSPEAIKEAVRLLGGNVTVSEIANESGASVAWKSNVKVAGFATIREPAQLFAPETKVEQRPDPVKTTGERTVVAPDGQRIDVVRSQATPKGPGSWAWLWSHDGSRFMGPVANGQVVPMAHAPTDAEVLADYWKWSMQRARDEGKREAEKAAPKDPMYGTVIDYEMIFDQLRKLDNSTKKPAVPTTGERDICAPDGTRIKVAKIRSIAGDDLGWAWGWMTNPSPCTYASGGSMLPDTEPTNEEIVSYYEDWKLRKMAAQKVSAEGALDFGKAADGARRVAAALDSLTADIERISNQPARSHFDPWRNKWVTE